MDAEYLIFPTIILACVGFLVYRSLRKDRPLLATGGIVFNLVGAFLACADLKKWFGFLSLSILAFIVLPIVISSLVNHAEDQAIERERKATADATEARQLRTTQIDEEIQELNYCYALDIGDFLSVLYRSDSNKEFNEVFLSYQAFRKQLNHQSEEITHHALEYGIGRQLLLHRR